jgi:two-component SAPR family response regulator
MTVAIEPEPVPPTGPGEAPAARRIFPAGPGTDALAEAIGELTTALDARLARIDSQLASVRRLLVQPAFDTAPFPSGAGEFAATVCCLGPFRFRVHGSSVDNWRSGKARALFQYLVNHRGQSIPRDTLIQALWPDPAAAAPGTSLKVAVHHLRQALNQSDGQRDGTVEVDRGDEVDRGPSVAPIAVISQGSCYQLRATDLWLDVEEFEHRYALGRALEAQGQEAAALVMFARAAELYRGDFLEEIADDWPTFRREALKDQYLFVLARLAAAAAATGNYQDAIVWCQRLLAKDCCREDTYRLLMLCHARLGQRSRVRSWYELCVRTIRSELDCAPEPETERVYRTALAGKL